MTFAFPWSPSGPPSKPPRAASPVAPCPPARRSLRAVALLALLEACATTDTTAQPAATPTAVAQDQPAPRRRRRRRRRAPPPEVAAAMPTTTDGDAGAPASTDPGAAGGSTASFGSPVVTTAAPEFTPAWVSRNGRNVLVCEGASTRPLSLCPQCRDVPDNAAIVRAFVAVERPVLQCEPPADNNGRLPIRAVFSGAGVPLEATFPGVNVSEHEALCIGQALCRMRMPTLRAAEATVNYEYVVLLPSSGE